jgi:hypothetical protein
MSRDGAIIFADLIGKLDVLYVPCPKCSRAGPLSGAAFNRGMRTLALNEMITGRGWPNGQLIWRRLTLPSQS